MVQIFQFLPLRCISLTGRLIKDNQRGAFYHSHGVGTTTLQTRCCNASTQAYHQPEPTSRRSANYQPSSWNYILYGSTNEQDNEWENQTKTLKKLEDEVRCMLDDENLKPSALLEIINDIDKLGLSYRYSRSINNALDKLQYLKESTGEVTKSLYVSALYFRLLRQHGFEVPTDLFKKFRDDDGNFKQSLAWDIRGMLSLYEASYLACEGENILEEAKRFTSVHLKDSKEFVDSIMSEQINHALDLPAHYRTPRLETRWNIEAYDKRNDKNQVLLDLAKLEFNMMQSTLQNDLQEVSRWWKVVGLADKLDFARDRLTESFFWAVGMAFEPQFSKCRIGVTKAYTLITVLDDIYDVYGSLDELEQFTYAVGRWDLDAMKDLPDYMKLFFLALFNTVNEMAYDALKEHGQMIIPDLKKAWADLCKSFLQEAKWYYEKVTPTFDEYIENAWISSSGAVQLIHSYFSVIENISQETRQCLDSHHSFLRWPCTIYRLKNDLASSKAEIERGETTNAITCLMHETGLSEAFARQHISRMIEECWMKMNKQLISPRAFEENFTQVAINLARIALCQYQYRDAHSDPDDTARNRIFSVIMNPVL